MPPVSLATFFTVPRAADPPHREVPEADLRHRIIRDLRRAVFWKEGKSARVCCAVPEHPMVLRQASRRLSLISPR